MHQMKQNTEKRKDKYIMNKDLQTMIKALNHAEREEVLNLIEQMNKQKKLFDVAVGETFFIGEYEFIKFGVESADRVVAVLKDCLPALKFGSNNNFAESEILNNLEIGFLKEIAELVGEENILKHQTDLLALDGTDDYVPVISKVSIPTFDFYRQNRKIFDNYKVDNYWWLSTPDSCNNDYSICVSPSGCIINGNYRNYSTAFVRFLSLNLLSLYLE